MRHRIGASALTCFVVLSTSPAAAQWLADGVPLTTASTVPATHAVAPDGSGGLLAAWSELRDGQYDIYAQRVTAAGVLAWSAQGVPVCAATFDQVVPAICTDGQGGAIIVWRDQRGGGLDIYAQRVDALGAPQWVANGVAVCAVVNNQYAPVIVSDGAGGAVIAWYDYRVLNYDIYAQRVDGEGTALWTAGGVAVYAAQYNQFNPMIATDGAGGAIVAWTDIRDGNADLYARRVTSAGTPVWSPAGVALCTNPFDQLDPVLVSDEAGGAIVAWRDRRNGTWDIFAQRVGPAGAVAWTANGVAVCAAPFDQLRPAIACDGAAGAVVVWDDARNGSATDIFAQRLGAGGAAAWAANGIAVCTAEGSQTRPSVVSDAEGGAIIAWEDRRAGGADVFAQRMGTAGTALWAADDVAVCVASGDQSAPLAVADGVGGAAMAWRDSRNGNTDLFAQRLGPSGGTPTGARAATPAFLVSFGYPNPTPRAMRFDIEAGGAPVALEVFDVTGRRVARTEGAAGGVWFDGRDERGRLLPCGVYLCRFSSRGSSQTRKVVIAR